MTLGTRINRHHNSRLTNMRNSLPSNSYRARRPTPKLRILTSSRP